MRRWLLVLAVAGAWAGAWPAAASAQGAPTTAPPAVSLIAPAIRVADLDRSLRFYATALGLVPATTLHHGTVTEVILSADPKLPRPVLIVLHDERAGAPPIDLGTGFAKIVLRVADIPAVAARMTAAHYPVGAPRANAAGPSVLMIRDPDGYALELVSGGAHG